MSGADKRSILTITAKDVLLQEIFSRELAMKGVDLGKSKRRVKR